VTTPLQIRVSLPAQGQIEEAAAWWAENRPAAPGAIRDDLADILNVLVRQPGIGVSARRSRVKGLRRVTLKRVRYYLYYRVSGDALEVLAFWHTSRGQSPRIEAQ